MLAIPSSVSPRQNHTLAPFVPAGAMASPGGTEQPLLDNLGSASNLCGDRPCPIWSSQLSQIDPREIQFVTDILGRNLSFVEAMEVYYHNTSGGSVRHALSSVRHAVGRFAQWLSDVDAELERPPLVSGSAIPLTPNAHIQPGSDGSTPAENTSTNDTRSRNERSTDQIECRCYKTGTLPICVDNPDLTRSQDPSTTPASTARAPRTHSASLGVLTPASARVGRSARFTGKAGDRVVVSLGWYVPSRVLRIGTSSKVGGAGQLTARIFRGDGEYGPSFDSFASVPTGYGYRIDINSAPYKFSSRALEIEVEFIATEDFTDLDIRAKRHIAQKR